MDNILAKRSRRGLFDNASYLLLNAENRKLKICNARLHGLMIRRDGNILEADKAGRIPLGVVENNNYIEEKIVLLLPGVLVFLYQDRAVEPLNRQMEKIGMERIQSIQMKSDGTRKETMLLRSSFRMILV